jgi:hypothetical protein
MCFSAVASFSAAGFLIVLGAISVALIYLLANQSMTAIQKHALLTLAAVPLLFGFHQLSEGLVWIDSSNQTAVRMFAYTAYTFWPMYISLSLALVEWTRSPSTAQEKGRCCSWPRVFPLRIRRWLLVLNVILGVVLFAVLTACLAESEPITVETEGGRLEYTICSIPEGQTYLAVFVYAYVVIGSLVLSSVKYTSLSGWASLLSLVVTLALWKAQFQSTWCFFAAILSFIIVWTVWNELQEYRPSNKSRPITDMDQNDPRKSGLAVAVDEV